MTLREQILSDYGAMLNDIFPTYRVERGIRTLEEIKPAEMPLLMYNSVSTTRDESAERYTRQHVRLTIETIMVDRDTSPAYMRTIDDYVTKLIHGLDAYEQFSDNVLKMDYTIDETINDDYIDGLIVLRIMTTVLYYDPR